MNVENIKLFIFLLKTFLLFLKMLLSSYSNKYLYMTTITCVTPLVCFLLLKIKSPYLVHYALTRVVPCRASFHDFTHSTLKPVNSFPRRAMGSKSQSLPKKAVDPYHNILNGVSFKFHSDLDTYWYI